MRKILIAAAAGAALIAAGVAVAETAGAPAPGAAPAGGPHRMMEEADTNHDGTISRAEFNTGVQARFARLDTNRDGSLSREEMQAGRPDRGPGGPGHEGHRGRGHRNPDANNDGVTTRQEFLAGPTAMFERLDANHDGRLTAEERPQRGEGRHERHSMRGADSNRDGRVTLAEYTARSEQMFTRMDANSDGQLTQADREARRQR